MAAAMVRSDSWRGPPLALVSGTAVDLVRHMLAISAGKYQMRAGYYRCLVFVIIGGGQGCFLRHSRHRFLLLLLGGFALHVVCMAWAIFWFLVLVLVGRWQGWFSGLWLLLLDLVRGFAFHVGWYFWRFVRGFVAVVLEYVGWWL